MLLLNILIILYTIFIGILLHLWFDNQPCIFVLYKHFLQVPPIEYPATYSAAILQIKQQKTQLDAAKEYLLKGDLNQCGLILLDVVPKLSSSGKVILKAFNDSLNKERNLQMKKQKGKNNINDAIKESENATSINMKSYRFEYTMNELLGYLGETDVLLGQGLRGELGVSAPAQIQILQSLGEAEREFDEMLRILPDKI